MKNNNSIYEFENGLLSSVITEKPTHRTMYDIRKMSEHIEKTGRTLTPEEAQMFVIS